MPWTTPSLSEVRKLTRDKVTTILPGAALIGNSVLRVMSDAQAGLAHLVLLYIDWLSRQFLPDTAETEWLERHGNIWIVNADGSKGRKVATFATGIVTATGARGLVIPSGTLLSGTIGYETTEQVVLDIAETPINVRALDPGAAGNMATGEPLSFDTAISGIDGTATVVTMSGGTDAESDTDLRQRVLHRIQNPPMGGDKEDYVDWVEAYAGVTRAWSYPLEMGMGTVTVRFMMDDLRFDNSGFPLQQDVDAVTFYLNQKRPVAVKDFFVVSPIPFPLTVTILNLDDDSADVRAAIEQSIRDMLFVRAEPGAPVYASWMSEAITAASGEDHHTLEFDDTFMPSTGHMATLGTIIYE